MPVGKKGPILRPLHTKPSGLSLLFSPATVGTLTAAAFAAAPRLASVPTRILDSGVRWTGAGQISPRIYSLLFGFLLGFGVVKSSVWLKWRILKALFNYHGWVYNQKSLTTKAWGTLVKLLSGSGGHSTYEFQSLIPHQRVPDLDKTLNMYLEISKVLLPEEDYEVTVQLVEEFRVHEGPRLQEHLKKRAEEKDSWLAEYWSAAAYLSCRDPTAINSNFGCCNGIPIHRCHSQLARAAEFTSKMCYFYEKVQTETLEPFRLQGLVPLCVSAYRVVFNSARIPKAFMDTVEIHPNNPHVVVFRKGHYFKMDVYAEDDSGEFTLLTVEELRDQFARIFELADEAGPGSEVAVLTSQKRDVWAEQYPKLRELNKDTMHAIDSAMFMIVLDDYTPKDPSDHARRILMGNGSDRYFDKVVTSVFFNTENSDACRMGINVEHSSVDATYIVELFEKSLEMENFENGELVTNPDKPPRGLPDPHRLKWDLTGMEDHIKQAKESYSFMTQNFQNSSFQSSYGKSFMKKQRLSPDGYVQMAIQLAYYRQHNEIPKTYEPATGRLFLKGRTETVHPVSSYSCDWVKAMDDPKSDPKACIDLLRKAIEHQTRYRLDATTGQGCDRHMLGLYCAARELGMDIPSIFTTKVWQMPFKLSTSQTPTKMATMDVVVDWPSNGGIFGPVCQDGYGIAYVNAKEEFVGFNITNWKFMGTTDSVKLGQAICHAMEDMKTLLSTKELPSRLKAHY